MRYPHMLHRRNFLAILLRGHLHCQCGYVWYVWTEPCWELLNIRIYTVRNEQGGFEICRIMVKLQRRHAFLMVNIFSPFLLLTIVNLFVFMVPMDSAGSVSYAITVLLSFTVFLSLVKANTRKSSLTVSLFSVYMLMVLFYSFLITISVVVISDIHFTKVGHTANWNLSRTVVWGLKKQKFKIQRSFI